jgi:hypothetical protein
MEKFGKIENFGKIWGKLKKFGKFWENWGKLKKLARKLWFRRVVGRLPMGFRCFSPLIRQC